MRFDRAEYSQPGEAQCASCEQPLVREYHEVNGRTICTGCRQRIEASLGAGASPGQFWRALVYGAGAAAVGAAIWYAIVALTGIELGLIAILIGFMVGKAVLRGSGYRGGWRYQALAMLLTYAAIVASYVPAVYRTLDSPSVAAVALIALAAPFLMGVKNILGLVIIGIGLYQAWKLNRRRRAVINGPYTIAGSVEAE